MLAPSGLRSGRRLLDALHPHAIHTLFAAIPSPTSDMKVRAEGHAHARFDDLFGKGRLRMLDWMLRRARGLGSNGLAIACALALSSAASAATLQVSGGQLFGASGVLVDGQLYDVAFIDGSCVAVFGGCDEVSDFVIQTETLAELAGQALLDQVLLDVPGLGLFDTDTELTHGITANNSGRIQTPFGFSEAGSLMVWTSWNRPTFDNHHINFTSPTLDYGYDDDLTYAVWTPVPEPGTGVLMGMGLLGMGWHRRRTR